MKKKSKIRETVNQEKLTASSQSRDYSNLIVFGAYFILAYFLYRGIFVPGQAVWSGDFAPWGVKMYKDQLWSGSWQKWLPYSYAGADYQALFLYPNFILMMIFPSQFFIGFEYALDVFLLGSFMFLFLRELDIDPFPAFIGGLCLMFTSHVITQTYPGHLGKTETFAWTPLVFMYVTRGIRTNKIFNFILAGIFIGLQILGGSVDVTYFLCMVLSFYFLYLSLSVYKEPSSTIFLKRCGFFFLAVVVALILSAQTALYFLSTASSAATPESMKIQKTQDKTGEESGYEFATSWSFPPEEIFTLFVKRPFGNVTGDGYWGRIGSKGMTLKLNDDYMGIMPLILAIIGIVGMGWKRTRFWAIAALVCLLIAFGGYTPIYKLIYKLPFVSKFRAPTKWVFPMVFCSCVLMGYGAQYLYNLDFKKEVTSKIKMKYILFVLTTVSILFLVGTLIGSLFAEKFVASIQSAFEKRNILLDFSTLIQRYNIAINGFWRTTFLLVLATIIFVVIYTIKNWNKNRIYMFYAISLFILYDLWSAGGYFIQYYNFNDHYTPHPITQFLMDDPDLPRVKLFMPNGLISNLSGDQFKYYKISCWDTPSGRPPADYTQFMEKVATKNFPAFLDVFSIKYLASGQPVNFSLFRQAIASQGGYLYQYENYVPRVYLLDKYKVFKNLDQLLDNMTSQDYNVREYISFLEDPKLPNSDTTVFSTQGVKITQYAPNEVEISATTPNDTFLVLTDYYFPNWKAYLDNQETRIYRANYLVRAIRLPKGEHNIRFVYDPPMPGLYITLISWIVILVFIAVYLIRQRKMRKKSA